MNVQPKQFTIRAEAQIRVLLKVVADLFKVRPEAEAAAVQVVDVVVADAAGEPLQDLGEPVERCAVHGGGGEVPRRAALPIDAFVLVLNVEEPDTRSAGAEQDSKLNDQKRLQPEQADQSRCRRTIPRLPEVIVIRSRRQRRGAVR